MTAKLLKLSKRGEDRLLSYRAWFSASFDPCSHQLAYFSIWFREHHGAESRYRIDLDRESAEHLHKMLGEGLARDESDWRGRPFHFPKG